MITAMNESTITLLVIAVLAATAYAAYLVAVIRDDGLSLARRQPPASHHRDPFDPATGPSRLA